MRTPLLTTIGVLIVAISGCRAESEAQPTGYELCGRTGIYRNQQGILRICAPITDSVVAQVSEQLTPTDREVILTSDGGPQIPAIALADLLRERGVTVRVRQFCLSSCSTYVMAMVNAVVVDPYTVVAFHHTAAFAIDAVAARNGLAEDCIQRRMARAERDAYRAAGRDDRMLDRIAMAVEPRCAGMRDVSGRPEAYLDYRWSWYIPDRETARHIYGDRISGHWMKDADEAASILRMSLDRPNDTVRFGPLPSGESRPEIIGPGLPECQASLRS